VTVPVALYWHQWQIDAPSDAPAPRLALLDRVGLALADGARSALAQETAAQRPRRRWRDV
jgi:hypothetical protein